MIQGQKGVAKFAYDTMLKDEEGKLKYICTDPSRQIFQYKNEEGEIQKDVKAKKLTKALLDGELKSVSRENPSLYSRWFMVQRVMNLENNQIKQARDNLNYLIKNYEKWME